MGFSFLKASREQMQMPPKKLQLALLVFSIFYFFRWFYEAMSPLEWCVQIGAYLLFLSLYLSSFRFVQWVVPIGLSMVALSIAIAPQNPGANTFAIYAANVFAFTLPRNRAVGYVVFIVGIMALATFVLNLHMVAYLIIGGAMALGGGVSGVITRQNVLHLQRQNKSKQEISRLAKIAERERIGQDIHDLLGHSLTVIHLKSQLALRLLEEDAVENAKKEISEIHTTAQVAIKEVRQAVTGYKTHGLQSELLSQKTFLASMGIALEYKLPTAILPPIFESDLLLITREALTNILRHSSATQCSVNYVTDDKGIVLTIKDNGRGIVAEYQQSTGSGVTGMAKRVASRGGEFSITNSAGTTIDIFIPWVINDE